MRMCFKLFFISKTKTCPLRQILFIKILVSSKIDGLYIYEYMPLNKNVRNILNFWQFLLDRQ